VEQEQQNVVITNIKIPFFSLAWFMIKWVFALIPALLLMIVLVVGVVIIDGMFNISEMLQSMLP